MESENGNVSSFREAVERLLGSGWQNKSWDELFTDRLKTAALDMPRVNVILFGLSGVGKSTLINSLLRKPLAPVGVGDPVTMAVERYEEPGIPITLFDTRGAELGENPGVLLDRLIQDIRSRYLLPESEYVHLALYCVREADRRFFSAEELLICEIAKTIPVLLVLTQCYETEDTSEVQELSGKILDKNMPIVGRRVFRTVAERRKSGPHWTEPHGLLELVDAMYDALPAARRRALVNGQAVNIELKVKEARKCIPKYSGMAGLIGAVPIPIVDTAPLTATQVAMLAEIHSVMGLEIDEMAIIGSLLPVLGTATAGRSAAKALLTFVPVAGWAINGGVAASLTVALGEWYINACARAMRRIEDTSRRLSAAEVQAMILDEVKRDADTWKDSAKNLWKRMWN